MARVVVATFGAGGAGAAMVSASEAVAACGEASESFTVTLNEEVPLADGVPLMAPAVERVRPAGREPEARLQV